MIMCIISASVGMASEMNLTFAGHIGGNINAIAVSGNYSYVGQGQEIVVVNWKGSIHRLVKRVNT